MHLIKFFPFTAQVVFDVTRRWRWAGATFLLLAISGAASAGATRHVDADSTATNPTGSDWTNAFKHLQNALFLANDGDEIWVAAGTYWPDRTTLNPTGSGLPSATFTLKNGVHIYGGFVGGINGETNKNERDSVANVTILSGAIGGSGNSYHVVTAPPGTLTALIDGFTITHGDSTGAPGFPITGHTGGGGLAAYRSNSLDPLEQHCSATVLRCRFTENLGERGAAIYYLGGSGDTLEIRNCVFDNNGNEDTTEGGAIHGRSRLEIVNSLFYCNKADEGSAVFSTFVHHTMVNCTVALNSSPVGGASLFHPNSYPLPLPPLDSRIELDSSIVYDNTRMVGGNPVADLAAQISGAVVPRYSCVKSLGSPYPVGGSSHNINSDPQFVDDHCSTQDEPDFRLAYGSQAINGGQNSFVLSDDYDLFQDAGSDDEPNPDLDITCRIIALVDMGVYEHDPCCTGNIDHTGRSACRVDVDDLLAVIEGWGPCGGVCVADIAPGGLRRWAGSRG